MTTLSPLAGKPADPMTLVDVPKLVTAYYTDQPDPAVVSERVAFGTSGHRGSALQRAFNEAHILAITQAICDYRRREGISGPLFLGIDTHALSVPAQATALEVLAANEVTVMVASGSDYTPTPAVSLAILNYNRGRAAALADGIVVTPSHNPPADGGFKYNPPSGGPADGKVTGWIEARANELLTQKLAGVKRVTLAAALRAPTTRQHDYIQEYVDDLRNVIDMETLRHGKVSLGVDPLGGAGIHYWGRIAEAYHLDLTVVNQVVDPTFRFMCVDWDGKIRMDPSSPQAMAGLIKEKDHFDLVGACDTDHDRHGIVTRSAGLMQPNHYLAVAAQYLFQNRPQWSAKVAVAKTVVSSAMIDRVAKKLGRPLVETPVGFKWFVDGLIGGTIGFAGEESAGASFLRRDGRIWTSDKDGLIAVLLAGEIKARTGRDPSEHYQALTKELGEPSYDRREAAATIEQKKRLGSLAASEVTAKELAGESIEQISTRAPGNDAPIGGLKVATKNGWFAARPSGTEQIYKIYGESFLGPDHLERIMSEAQQLVDRALS